MRSVCRSVYVYSNDLACPELYARPPMARLIEALRDLRRKRSSFAPPTAGDMAAGVSEVGASMATVPGVTERYFTRWYKPDVKGNLCEDHCILQHSNRICVITVADAHPLLQNGKPIKSISYQISANCSRLQNKVSGKSKRGAQFLTELAPLCRILCSDGEEYTIYSCIRGKLIEVNENILDNPSLLQEKPSTEGYIAVVLPKFEESKKVTQGLLTREEYEEFLSKRFNSTSLYNTKNENLAEI